MNANQHFCGSTDHGVTRRAFLSRVGVGAALLGTSGAVHTFAEEGLTRALKASGKRVILLWLAGGASQLETWDPKPGRPTGGPFAAIPTSVPGVHICELMPEMAKRMKDLAIIRSLNSRNADHGGGAVLMMRGRQDEPTVKYPDLGAILAKELGRADSKVPDYISLYAAAEGRDFSRVSSGFLGARFNPMKLAENMTPPNMKRLDSISDVDHHARAELQEMLNRQFITGRELPSTKSHANAYARVHGLMSSEQLFDISHESESVKQMYGPTLFGQQALMARRMVEAGVPFVRVARAWWDSHGQNFETHQEMVPELDRVMAALMDDLKQRGMQDDVLVVAMGEFGRTPTINSSLGRDHFGSAWSVAMFGGKLKHGVVYGKTDKDGKEVAEDQVGAGEIFATILEAAGIRHDKEYHIGARPIPLVNPGIKPIKEVLA
ncbi:MAG: DUF1501 domain-containing protein [Pedosphaera sp.]|nr:DUF1501 domain-containing protein [Pedosphaera sp.]MST00154.1 DUF1501 domain-containing protein [Pedosphaera sp.]